MPDFHKKESTYDIGWMPKTRLGQLVYQGKITTMSEALASRHALKEPEIVDILLPEIEDDVLDVNMVQRMTDSGRRVRFAITVVVGNGDGFVGMGRAKGKEVGPTIRNAIDRAKLNIIEIKRGCGSWECGCGNPHTLPFEVEGKCGSVRVVLKPAPRGVGLALGSVAKKVASMAGIKDAWGFAKGHTKTTVNYSFAAFEALRETSRVKITETQTKNLHIMSGPSQVVYLETSPEELKRLLEEKKKREREKISEKTKAIVKDAAIVVEDEVSDDEADTEPETKGKDSRPESRRERRPAEGKPRTGDKASPAPEKKKDDFEGRKERTNSKSEDKESDTPARKDEGGVPSKGEGGAPSTRKGEGEASSKGEPDKPTVQTDKGRLPTGRKVDDDSAKKEEDGGPPTGRKGGDGKAPSENEVGKQSSAGKKGADESEEKKGGESG
jgi:small subunit ribosomal protein S5